jgi:hypothetical protein
MKLERLGTKAVTLTLEGGRLGPCLKERLGDGELAA